MASVPLSGSHLLPIKLWLVELSGSMAFSTSLENKSLSLGLSSRLSFQKLISVPLSNSNVNSAQKVCLHSLIPSRSMIPVSRYGVFLSMVMFRAYISFSKFYLLRYLGMRSSSATILLAMLCSYFLNWDIPVLLPSSQHILAPMPLGDILSSPFLDFAIRICFLFYLCFFSYPFQNSVYR